MTVLVHDYLLVMRGAERQFSTIADLYPNAPVATLLYDEHVFDSRLQGHTIRTSPIQRLGLRQRTFHMLLPLLPAAVERLDVSGHNLVLSSSSAFAHGVRPDRDAVHVCYCHTPFRYAWYARQAGLAQVPRLLRSPTNATLEYVRRWDRRAAGRDTYYIANSRLTQRRIKQYWDRDVPVLNASVELDRFAPGQPEDFFLVVGELIKHKQTAVALEAARRAGVPIKVVGTGQDEKGLRQAYGNSAEFLGRLDDAALAEVYSRARALVMPNIEEFGITSVEAQASGRPVIAADGGGSQETVLADETGLFFPSGEVDALAAAMRSPQLDEMAPMRAVLNAQRFSADAFHEAFKQHVGLARERAGG